MKLHGTFSALSGLTPTGAIAARTDPYWRKLPLGNFTPDQDVAFIAFDLPR